MPEKKVKIDGVEQEAEIVTNAEGGKQSYTPYGFHLIPMEALFSLAKRYQFGAERYERDNWRKISQEQHLNHAMQHICAYLAGDMQDDHLGAAICRLSMAIGVGDASAKEN